MNRDPKTGQAQVAVHEQKDANGKVIGYAAAANIGTEANNFGAGFGNDANDPAGPNRSGVKIQKEGGGSASKSKK